MSKQLYEEALADVKKLKEIAEDNAKKALIEAVSPRIKDLIEAELLREADGKETEDDLLLDEPMVANPGSLEQLDQAPEETDMFGMDDLGADLDPAVATAMDTDEEGKVTLDLDALNVQPEKEYSLSSESLKLLSPLMGKFDGEASTKVESKLFQISEATQKLYNVHKNLKNSHIYQQKIAEMVSAVEDLYVYLQESAGSLHRKEFYEGKLEDLYKQLNKLAEQGNMRIKSLNEAELTLKLKNVPDELEDSLGDLEVELEPGGETPEEEPEGEEPEGEEGGEEESSEESEDEESGDEEGSEDLLDLGGEEEEKKEGVSMESRRLSDNTIVEIDEGMLRREIARMKALREADETKPQSWGHGAGDVSDDMDFEEDDLGDPLDMDITTESDVEETDAMGEVDGVGQAYEADMSEEDMPEADMPEEDMPEADMPEAEDADKHNDPNEQSNKQNRQVESARRRIAAELKLQTEARKRAKQAKQKEQQVKQKAQAKKTQAKKQQDKKSQAKCQSEAVAYERQAKKLAEAYAHYASVYNESVRRTAKLKSVLNESLRGADRNGASTRSAAETSILRKKLAETNLFNTKLVYCNKLLQNESLTKRQKAEIIERMDEAATEREVKLVYESLIKTLSGTSRPMTEGRAPRVLGSSSQATRPASTVLSEGYEADRWAKLAGLK